MASQTLNQQSSKEPKKQARLDRMALWGGIAFCFLYTVLVWAIGGRLDRIELAPDTGFAHYFWKLPDPTVMSRLTAWGFYLAHQFAIFGLIWYGQKYVKKYTNGLHKLNIWALGVNAFFIMLHLLQTHIWYDGLAQDVSILSSQGSVIVLLVWVLLMENNRRGLVWGKKLPVGKEVMRFARKYHGYFFSWAVIYTFWYHPMVSTSGHLIGTFYTLLLMLQASLMFTRAHTNRYWTFALEFIVLIHGTLVAIMQAGLEGFWPMFFFGFGGIFVITQMHGLGLGRNARLLLLTGYIAFVLGIYNWRGWENLNEIIRIPVIDYVLVIALALIFWAGIRVAELIRRPRQSV